MSEERDLEKELKEARDQYEAENQEIYDEVTKGNEELRRKQEKEAEEEENTDEDPTTDKLESRGYKGNRESARQRQIRLRQKALADRDTEGSTVTRGPGQVFTGGKDTVEVPDRDMRTGQLIPNETELDQFGNPLLAAGFEITANTILDLFSPVLPLQSGGSYVINLISQIIRDPSKIGSLNQLEAGAAATSSLIPGANQYAAFLKGVKPATRGTQLARQIGRGAVDANIQITGMKVGEGEEVTFDDLTAATLFGGGLGGIVGVTPEILKGKTDDLSKVFRNIRKRLDGGPELVTPEGVNVGQATPEFEPTTAFAIKGKNNEGISPEDFKKQFEPQKPTEGGFTKESIQQSISKRDQELSAIYATEKATLGDTLDEQDLGFKPTDKLTPKQKRIKFTRTLKADDLDYIVKEEAAYGRVIPESKKQEYIDLVNDTRIGKKDRNNPSGRLRRNQKGYIGTMVYLNEVSLGTNPNTLGNSANVIKHISKEMGIDPVGLKKIIEDQGGEIVFQTEGMTTPKIIRTLTDLKEAYYLRLARYKEIPAFEKGHVFAAKNIIDDRDISDLTDFYNNLEPEISRSIREQLGDDTIEKLIKTKGTDQTEAFYQTIVEGNRKRTNRSDPDKIIADLLGTQYGLRESFLTFVYPERSLSNVIPIESKAAFADLYKQELLEEIKGLKADLRNSGQSSVGPATIDQMKLRVAREVARGMKNNKLLNAIILVDDKINKRGMTEKGLAKPLPDNPVKTDDDGLIRGDTPE